MLELLDIKPRELVSSAGPEVERNTVRQSNEAWDWREILFKLSKMMSCGKLVSQQSLTFGVHRDNAPIPEYHAAKVRSRTLLNPPRNNFCTKATKILSKLC